MKYEILDWFYDPFSSFNWYRLVKRDTELIGKIRIEAKANIDNVKYYISFPKYFLIFKEDFLEKEYVLCYPKNDLIYNNLEDAKQRIDDFIKKLANLKLFL